MTIKHAAIIPLIGGLPLGQELAFNSELEYILSYEAFSNNDNHYVKYKPNVPYYLLDENNNKFASVDVIGTTCPCAGLSSLSPSSNSESTVNDWMINSAQFILGQVKPKVFWGENAPRLASKMGAPVVNKLRAIAEQNGYTMSIFKTKSILHGLSQVRDRTFYFFWKGDKVPLFKYIKREHERIEDTIRNVGRDPKDPMDVLTNTNIPSQNPFYRFVLEEIEGGITHQDFFNKIEKTTNPMDHIENNKVSYLEVAKWMTSNGFEKQAERCKIIHDKLTAGGNIMRKLVEVPKDHIGAFVGHLPSQLTHPDEDRFLTIREALSIMKLPKDFILQGGKSNLNHICQNVPVTTAYDMAVSVKEYLNGELPFLDTKFAIQDNKTQTVEYEKESVQLIQFMV